MPFACLFNYKMFRKNKNVLIDNSICIANSNNVEVFIVLFHACMNSAGIRS